jgi:hypothetical protein
MIGVQGDKLVEVPLDLVTTRERTGDKSLINLARVLSV